jgi:prevent-host-death family protein
VAAHAADTIRSDWPLQDAKARFSELVRRAREQGPQHVTVRGAPAVVVISEEEFARLTSPRLLIVDHILEGPPRPEDVVEAADRATSAELLYSDIPCRSVGGASL